MNKAHISLRIATDTLQAVDRIAFDRRILNAPGRSATRSAVIADLIRRGMEHHTATQKDEDR